MVEEHYSKNEECERILKDKVESGNKPKAFVFENVRGIISSKMCNRKNESRVKSKRNAKFFIKTRCEIYFTHVIQKVKAFNQCFKID